MSGFFRPEAMSALIRWREVLVGGGVIALGTWWSFSAGPVLRWVAVLMVISGGAILWEGLRRVRLPKGGGGPGVVQVTERQITYLSPDQGGILSVDDLTRVEIRTLQGQITWIFYALGQSPILIPGNAEGAERIFDALAALPGINYDQAIDADGSSDSDIFLVWQKDRHALH